MFSKEKALLFLWYYNPEQTDKTILTFITIKKRMLFLVPVASLGHAPDTYNIGRSVVYLKYTSYILQIDKTV